MKLCVAMIVLLMTLSSACAEHPEGPAAIGRALQAAMDSSIIDSGAVGVSAAVMFSDGALWTGVAGMSHDGAPITTDMLFDIASVQKNFQAALALELVEDGVFALDDSLGKWLSPSHHIDGGITIRQLLNLTSGIDDFVADANSPFRIGYTNIDFEKTWTWEEFESTFVDEPSFDPGSDCEYSTTNYIVLRRVIESAAGMKQTALLEDKVLKPNPLDHTRVDFSVPPSGGTRIAHGWFDTDGDGAPEDISANSLNWIVSLSPMLVYSTPGDLVRWMDALYHKKTVLKEESLDAMLRFGGPVRSEPLMKGYGLGVADLNLGAMMPQWEHVRVYGHLGNQYGYMTFAGYFPDFGVSVAVISNRGGDTASTQAILTVGGAVIDTILRHLEATGSNR